MILGIDRALKMKFNLMQSYDSSIVFYNLLQGWIPRGPAIR